MRSSIVWKRQGYAWRKASAILCYHQWYLGHKFYAQGLHPLPEKVKAINLTLDYWVITWSFCHYLSTILAPLYELLWAFTKWEWKKWQEETFLTSIRLLTSTQVLVHFDPTQEIVLSCDAAVYGIGAVLAHWLADGCEKIVGFLSQTLSNAERKYSQVEKKRLACVFGSRDFMRIFTAIPSH